MVQNQTMVQFSVEDNGPGIPTDKMDKLFHKFYQVDTSLIRKHGGSGLGLAISKGTEINLVEPGFNSIQNQVMRPILESIWVTESDMVILPGSYYEDPIFSWEPSLGVTDIEFFESKNLGHNYENNIFVRDINNGKLYYFKVNDNRTGLEFGKP